MILNFDITCNNYKEKIFETFTSSAFNNCTCPKCGAKKFHRHASYRRYIITAYDNIPDVTFIDILRVQCVSCKSTHAILPNDIIPFALHTTPVFLYMLKLYIIDQYSLNQAAKRAGVSVSLLLLKLRILKKFMPYIEQYLRIFAFYVKEASLSLKLILAFLLEPFFDDRKFFYCHKIPLFLNRRNTVSYPLRFTDYIS